MTEILEQRFRKFDVVVCDIDGCLLDELNPQIDLQLLAKIAEHNSKATTLHDRPIVTICSGRPQPFVECLSRLINNLSIPCVSENGVWLHHPATNQVECDPTITAEDIAATYKLESLVRRYVAEGAIVQVGKSASVSVIHEDTQWIENKLHSIREICEAHNLPFHMSRTWTCINCNLSKVSKTTGTRRLLQKLGIDKKRVAGIGDTFGDFGIAENVGYFCCPANAEEKIKTHAHYVSQHAICEGVLDILSHLSR